MQTQKNIAFNSVAHILFFAALLLIASCKGGKDSEQSSAKSGTNEPPKIDIHTAVVTGNMNVLKQHILAGTNLNERDPFGGSSPLVSASVFGKTEEAKALIEAGADLNFQNNDGSTALHTAAFFCRPEIVKMLLEKGADKTIKNKFNATPYESVAGPFSEAKNSYDVMGTILSPMGLKLDYPYIEKTRPEIAGMLK
ncbi:MAG TPA: ankyrin repeat domain-containing protein [Cytophagales bacterium]|nr:ankyrin repeat domain-containing protein [Cytophagales bacterium]